MKLSKEITPAGTLIAAIKPLTQLWCASLSGHAIPEMQAHSHTAAHPFLSSLLTAIFSDPDTGSSTLGQKINFL